MEVCASHDDVVARWVVLGEIVGQIEFSLLPVDSKLALLDLVLDPIESYVHGLGPLNFGTAIGKPIGGGVVVGNACECGLFPSQFEEDLSDVHRLLAIVEQGSNFGFGCCHHDVPHHDAAFDMHWAIRCGVVARLIGVAKIEVAAHLGSSLWFTEVQGIAVGIEDHVTLVEPYCGIWVGCCVI